MRFLLLLLCGSLAIALSAADAKPLTLAAVDQRTVTVDAIAVARAMPDRLEWQLQVKSVRPSMKDSRAEVEASIQNLKLALKTIGVPETALALSDVEQGRDYEWSGRKRAFKGFSALSSARLTITNFGLVQRLLSEVLGDDLISIRSMDQISDREGELRQQALAAAAQVARKKAEILASTLGAKVGEVVQIYETSFQDTSSYAGNWSGPIQAQVSSEPEETQRSAGVREITVRASIKVSFELVN